MHKNIGMPVYFALAAIFILLSVDFYLNKRFYQPTIDEFFRQPSKFKGSKVEFAGHVLNTSTDSFYMSINRRALKVYHPEFEPPRLGQLSALLELNADGTATAIQVHNYSYNYLKYLVSLLGFALFLYIFLKEWKFKGWRFIENA